MSPDWRWGFIYGVLFVAVTVSILTILVDKF